MAGEDPRLLRHLGSSPTSVTDLLEGPDGKLWVEKRMDAALVDESVVSLLEERRPDRVAVPTSHRREGGDIVTVSPYVPGDTLSRRVGDGGPLDPAGVALLGRWLCRAVSGLHGIGVVHRDLTPANIVIGPDAVTVIDCANARRFDTNPGASRDTRVLGTYGYAAPEQFGFAPTDPRSDVFSIGRVLAYAATGVEPSSTGFDAAWERFRSREPRLAAAVEKAVTFEPSLRPATVDELDRLLLAAGGAVDGRPGAALWRTVCGWALAIAPLLVTAYDWWVGLTEPQASLPLDRTDYLVQSTALLVFFVVLPCLGGALKLLRPQAGQAPWRALLEWAGWAALSAVAGTVLIYLLTLPS